MEKNEARSNQNDVIDIDYSVIVPFGLSSEMFFGSENSNNGEFLPEGT